MTFRTGANRNLTEGLDKKRMREKGERKGGREGDKERQIVLTNNDYIQNQHENRSECSGNICVTV